MKIRQNVKKIKTGSKNGFTLIELLVVIAIIGLLASIVLVSMGSARKRARDARRQADIRQIGTAMEFYYSDNSDKYLKTTAGANTVTAIGAYMPALPKDPLNTSPQQYTWTANSANQQLYCVYVKIENVANDYFCSSERGTLNKVYSSGAPSLGACCY